jgi:8-oxo-dGTP pyrophosphatase MutT (NUDIX family)
MVTLAFLKTRFQSLGQLQWQPEPAEARLILDRPPAVAAVLIPIVVRPAGLHVLLTVRTSHLNDHAGQISFPGGRREAKDASLIDTALRETEEEIGLPRKHISVLGCLPEYQTATNFEVTPVVGLVQAPFDLQLDAFEVAEVFEVPLGFLMSPQHHLRREFATHLGQRTCYVMSYALEQTGKCYEIWGATAAMIRNLYHVLSAKEK